MNKLLLLSILLGLIIFYLYRKLIYNPNQDKKQALKLSLLQKDFHDKETHFDIQNGFRVKWYILDDYDCWSQGGVPDAESDLSEWETTKPNKGLK